MVGIGWLFVLFARISWMRKKLVMILRADVIFELIIVDNFLISCVDAQPCVDLIVDDVK